MIDLRLIAAWACVVAALVFCDAATAQIASATKGDISAAPSADGADALFARWDKNHDRMLSPEEFRAGWNTLAADASSQRLHKQFVSLDADKNGCLSAKEYAHMELVKKAGKSAPPMSQFDAGKNSCLDFNEYANAVNYMLSHANK